MIIMDLIALLEKMKQERADLKVEVAEKQRKIDEITDEIDKLEDYLMEHGE